MSVIRSHGTKVIMPRTGPNPFWERIHDSYGGDELAWRRFVMLAIREGFEWPLPWIAEGFGMHKGTVCRDVRRAQRDVRQFIEAIRQERISVETPRETCDFRGFSDSQLMSEGWEFP